jgi:tetratricopeptide (TPR) repeat protein
MHRSRISLAFTLLVVHLAFVSAIRAEQKIAAAGESWRWVSNPRFEVLTNGSERRARKVIADLETFRASIEAMMGGQVGAPPEPVRILLFDRVWHMSPYQPLGADGKPASWDGYTIVRGDRTWFTLSNESDEFVPRMVLSGYAYRLIAEQFREQPAWLRSGLVDYLSAFRYVERDRRAEVGRPIAESMRYLNSSTHLSLRQVLSTTHEAWVGAGDVPRWLFDAKSWLLVHYLQVGSPDRAGALARFVQNRAAGMTDVEALEKAVGCSLQQLDQELSTYQRRSLMSFATLEIEPPSPGPIETRAAEPPDALYRLGEYLYELGTDRRTDALAHFASAGKPAPAEPLRVAELKFTPAPGAVTRVPGPRAPPAETRSLDELRAGVAGGDRSLAARAQYANLVRELAARDWEAAKPDLTPARRALREVILDSPRDEQLWYSLNWLYGAEPEPVDRDEGIEVYTRGMELAPEVERIAHGLTKLLVASGDYGRAKAALDAAVGRTPEARRAQFDTLLIDLDAREAKRLADAGDPRAGLRLLESRVAAVSETWRPSAEVALATFRGRLESHGIEAKYRASVALVNAQKVEEGGEALRRFVREHPEGPFAELAKQDLEKVDAYLERRRARNAPRLLTPPAPPPPPPPPGE